MQRCCHLGNASLVTTSPSGCHLVAQASCLKAAGLRLVCSTRQLASGWVCNVQVASFSFLEFFPCADCAPSIVTQQMHLTFWGDYLTLW